MARTFGFKLVDVVDDDLGISGSGCAERLGFERLVAALCSGGSEPCSVWSPPVSPTMAASDRSCSRWQTSIYAFPGLRTVKDDGHHFTAKKIRCNVVANALHSLPVIGRLNMG
ncbi:MAG: hypothetical protein GY788_28680 [bacterium]|nr:hypothetical protein [bacterium]